MPAANGNVVRFRVGPKSFYQTNSIQALRLYEITRDFAGFKGDELVYDLYTGPVPLPTLLPAMCAK
jgi:23S rRNA (uracil1939-C5)-methyltransferase